MGFPPSRKEETWEGKEEEEDSEEAVIYQAEHERNERRNERPCPLFERRPRPRRRWEESGELFFHLHRGRRRRRAAEIIFQISIGHFDFPFRLRKRKVVKAVVHCKCLESWKEKTQFLSVSFGLCGGGVGGTNSNDKLREFGEKFEYFMRGRARA